MIVSDGFTGNVALKVSEGVIETLFHMAWREITKNLFAKIGLLLMKGHLKRIYKRVDYSEYGRSPASGPEWDVHRRPRPEQFHRR